MSIPLDNLYEFLEKLSNKVYGDVVIYRFWPHGSKKIENLVGLKLRPWIEEIMLPHIICNDQEPLMFDFYQNYPPHDDWYRLLEKYECFDQTINLGRNSSIFNKKILLHSEKKSLDVDKYAGADFIPVYYWCHAFISLDWFRFAKHIFQNKKVKHTFLIYNRAWSGTREYRLKFSDLLVSYNLNSHCHTSFSVTDQSSGLDYQQYVLKNSQWKPKNNLEKYFDKNDTPSHYSATFEISDYEATDIEIVLETLFDDSRIHLTEKTCRPLSCGQPFILASACGSLEYLRSYGFKTFESVWDESYDTISDPYKRLEQIIKLMQTITQWDDNTKEKKLKQAQDIAEFNKKYFFSDEFFDLITAELEHNLKFGLNELISTNDSSRFINNRIKMSKHTELKEILLGKISNPSSRKLPEDHPRHKNFQTKNSIIKCLLTARKYYKSNSAQNSNKLSGQEISK